MFRETGSDGLTGKVDDHLSPVNCVHEGFLILKRNNFSPTSANNDHCVCVPLEAICQIPANKTGTSCDNDLSFHNDNLNKQNAF
ncbi:hypothetical protein GCM10023092_08180 [Rurimicrobium arvi]|uniref:Uncharacterized protein n=1 Tax=Rurimicrobium arvi TaxID=2049916 RepID=A0ABP8MLG0_9BACT